MIFIIESTITDAPIFRSVNVYRQPIGKTVLIQIKKKCQSNRLQTHNNKYCYINTITYFWIIA